MTTRKKQKPSKRAVAGPPLKLVLHTAYEGRQELFLRLRSKLQEEAAEWGDRLGCGVALMRDLIEHLRVP